MASTKDWKAPKTLNPELRPVWVDYLVEINRLALSRHPFERIEMSDEQFHAFSRSEGAEKILTTFVRELYELAVSVNASAKDPRQLLMVQGEPQVGAGSNFSGDPSGSIDVGLGSSMPSSAGGGTGPTAGASSEVSGMRGVSEKRAEAVSAAAKARSLADSGVAKPSVQPPNAPLKPGQVPQDQVQKTPPSPTPKIRILPNAKVGVEHRVAVVAALASGEEVRIVEAILPRELGLAFDSSTSELTGTPSTPGDHQLCFVVQLPGGEKVTAQTRLVVNPDPKSLWQINEPPGDAEFPKSHSDGKSVLGGNIRIAAGSRRGRSHEHAGSFRDDDFSVWHDSASGWSLVVVADGAGIAKFSREGSRIACEVFSGNVAQALTGGGGKALARRVSLWDTTHEEVTKEIVQRFTGIFRNCAIAAVDSIESVAAEHGANPKDFSTTLLAAAILREAGRTFVATFWVGDGAIAVYGPRGKNRLMGSPDSGEFAGQTRFLDRAIVSSPSIGSRVKIGTYENVTGVLLMTDGVSDPRFETDHGLADCGKWDSLWDEIAPLISSNNPSEAIVEWLNFFSLGNHDDRTLAVLW